MVVPLLKGLSLPLVLVFGADQVKCPAKRLFPIKVAAPRHNRPRLFVFGDHLRHDFLRTYHYGLSTLSRLAIDEGAMVLYHSARVANLGESAGNSPAHRLTIAGRLIR